MLRRLLCCLMIICAKPCLAKSDNIVSQMRRESRSANRCNMLTACADSESFFSEGGPTFS